MPRSWAATSKEQRVRVEVFQRSAQRFCRTVHRAERLPSFWLSARRQGPPDMQFLPGCNPEGSKISAFQVHGVFLLSIGILSRAKPGSKVMEYSLLWHSARQNARIFCINILLLGIFMQRVAGSYPQFDFHFAQNACICRLNSVYLHRRAGKPCPRICAVL